MKNNSGKSHSDEELRIENEIKKLKLSAFHDATFSENPDAELPPEIEHEWLNYIEEFENQFQNCSRVSVFERLGKPSFPSHKTLTGEQIEEQLDHLLKHMAENGIYLDTLCEVSHTEIYRFITEELFEEEIDDIRIEGMMSTFIYEEFYPNDRYNIEQTLWHFISEMFNPSFHSYLHIHLAEQCQTVDGHLISQKDAVKQATTFVELFDRMELVRLHDIKITVNDKQTEATASFEIHYTTHTAGQKNRSYKGGAEAVFERGKLGYWNMVTLRMPGFSF